MYKIQDAFDGANGERIDYIRTEALSTTSTPTITGANAENAMTNISASPTRNFFWSNMERK